MVPGFRLMKRRLGECAVSLLTCHERGYHIETSSIHCIAPCSLSYSEYPCREKNRELNSHHQRFHVRTTSTSEMKNFGEGHFLYFCFLKNMAFLFGFLALMPGLFNMAINISGGWYASGDFQLTTIGSFGPLSHEGSRFTMNWTKVGTLPSDGRSTQRGVTGGLFIFKV
jgi:hypothetical protein